MKKTISTQVIIALVPILTLCNFTFNSKYFLEIKVRAVGSICVPSKQIN